MTTQARNRSTVASAAEAAMGFLVRINDEDSDSIEARNEWIDHPIARHAYVSPLAGFDKEKA